MTLEKASPCKINLLLNILGKRPDGFHELESVFHPVHVCDQLSFKRAGSGLELTCNLPDLPTDARNLVHGAATEFMKTASITDGVQIHLEKKLPLAAGLGGGSANAATTLLGLNELFGKSLSPNGLQRIAETLGSDVPFFLQNQPALATGRGEKVQPLGFFPALSGNFLVLVYPGFGISTAWSYQQLMRFPHALNGQPGRAERLISLLQGNDIEVAGREFYNSLEAPALNKYPLLALYQEFFRANDASAALMSGSGSTTFALFKNKAAAERAIEKFRQNFGMPGWMAFIPFGMNLAD